MIIGADFQCVLQPMADRRRRFQSLLEPSLALPLLRGRFSQAYGRRGPRGGQGRAGGEAGGKIGAEGGAEVRKSRALGGRFLGNQPMPG